MKIRTFFAILLFGMMLFSCRTDDDSFDVTQIQALLNQGESPLTLYNGGIPIDSLYGKAWEGGLIFYFDIEAGTGLLSSFNDQSTEVIWGCNEKDIMLLNNVQTYPSSISGEETESGALIGEGIVNTSLILQNCEEEEIAAKICTNLGSDWFLPSRGELRLMGINLHLRGLGDFNSERNYWCSTEFSIDEAWCLKIGGGGSNCFKDQKNAVRAIKSF